MTPIQKKLKKVAGRFCFFRIKGYILLIKLNYYVKKKHQDCKDNSSKKPYQDYLRSCVEQHLPRWFFIPCTCECERTEVQQEFLLKEKRCNLPQPVVERVIRLTHTRNSVKSFMGVGVITTKTMGDFFYSHMFRPEGEPRILLGKLIPVYDPG